MVFQIREESGQQHGAIARVADRLGVNRETLRNWVRQTEVDGGSRPGTTTADAQRMAELERENRELRRATSFTFLGYTFRARSARDRGGNIFTAFLPAISKDALKRLSRTVRRWRLHRRTELSWAELAGMIDPIVRGWLRYYGAF